MTPRGPRFWVLHGAFPLVAFVALAWLFEATDLDLRLSDPFYDFSARQWTYQQAWWAKGLIHRVGRDAIALVFIGCLCVWPASWIGPRPRPWRRAATYLALVIALVTGTVGLAKACSVHHCPWSIDRYGGQAPRVGLFEALPAGIAPGRCFPAAHASGGFSLLGLYFVFRERGRTWAATGLVLGLGLGTLYGFGQVARGAHFVSHNVWTAAIAWGLALWLYAGPFGGRLRV